MRTGSPMSTRSSVSGSPPTWTTSPGKRAWTWERRFPSRISVPGNSRVITLPADCTATVRMPRLPGTSLGSRSAVDPPGTSTAGGSDFNVEPSSAAAGRFLSQKTKSPAQPGRRP